MILVGAFILSQTIFGFNVLAKGTRSDVLTDSQKNSVATNLGLFGGQANDIAIDSTSDNVYITTMAPNGFFISNDKGETWHGLPSSANYGTGKQVEVDSNGDVYVLIGDSLLKSSDHGVNFVDITNNLGTNNPLADTLLWGRNKILVALNFGLSQNLALSSDNGNTFSLITVGNGEKLRNFAVASDSDTFYASLDTTTSNMYKSTDGGLTWASMALPESMHVSAIAVDPDDNSHIVVGSSTGTTSKTYQKFGDGAWTELTDNGRTVSANHITFDGAGRLYVMQMYTTDNGATWQQVTTSTPVSGIYADHFAVDPNNINLLFTNSVYSIAKSVDRGVTWTDEADGITSVKVYDIAQANNKAVVWIAANGGLGKTTNFTASSPTWEYPVSGTGGTTVYAVWVDPADSNIVLYGSRNYIKKSIDGGVTFSTVVTIGTEDPGPGNIMEIASVPGKNNVLYAAMKDDSLSQTDYGYVYKSTDTGSTWTNIDLPGNAPASSLTITKDHDVFVGCSSSDSDALLGIYKYSSHAWSKIKGKTKNLPITSILADPKEAETIYATANADTGNGNTEGSGLYKTIDNGVTWTQITSGLESVNNLDTLTVQTTTSPHTLYLVGQARNLNGAIYKSSDGGETWGKFFEGLKQESFYALLFDRLMAGNDRGLYGLKSKANVGFISSAKKVSKGQAVTFTISLKDKATKKKLKNKTVKIYRVIAKKHRTVRKYFAKVKTDSNGKAILKTIITKKITLKAKWQPKKKKMKREYTTSWSKKVKIKIIK